MLQTMRSLIDHIAGLPITQGQGAGNPFGVLPWQKRFLNGAFKVRGDAALSVARGAGKSTLVAAIADACLRGPLRQPRGEVTVCASSLDQARQVFDECLSWIEDRKPYKIWNSQNGAKIECLRTGAKIRCIGSDPRRAHGLQPVLVLADEPAQWEPSKSDKMLAALRTSLGKIPGSRLIALGTRPADGDHWFARMLEGGGVDYCQVHAARPGDPPFHLRTWKRANPSLGFMPHQVERARKEAAAAKQDPSLMPSFEALRLNMGTAATVQRTLLDAGTWERIEGEADRIGDYALGLDLGSSEAMSAAAGYWLDTMLLDAFAVFPELPTLQERGLSDGVGRKYVDMKRQGDLFLAGKRVSDIGSLLIETLDRWGTPAMIVADRYREKELRDVLDAINYPRVPLVLRGMGYLDGAADVREFRRACLTGRVVPRRSLLLRYATSSARTVSDPAGNEKLAKNTQGGRRLRARDDAAAAALLSVAEGSRRSRQVRHGSIRHVIAG